MIVILSAKYIEQDLRAEFGELPPSFLPVGNQRLYIHQIERIRHYHSNEKVFLTLPKSFNMGDWDKLLLNRLGVSVVYIEDDFSLGQSIAFSLASCCNADEETVTIYYGDTLLRNPIDNSGVDRDVIYTAHSDFNYSWMVMENAAEEGESVFCGVLTVLKPQLLIRNLISSDFDFEKSLYKYNEVNPFIQIHREDWLDFGHLNTFYDSKTIVTTQRAFNELKINKYYVEKRSSKNEKLKAEANWFNNIPEDMAYYAPMLISFGEDKGHFKYKLEYLYFPTLTELFVYGNHPYSIWMQIIRACFHFVEKCSCIVGDESNITFYPSLVDKNKARLEEFIDKNPRFSGVVKDETGEGFILNDILDDSHGYIDKLSTSSFIHGDFCFSNILYDFKKNDIKVIDPRGIDFNGNVTVYGDIRYDLAKILHSAIGKYDYIISDRFTVQDDGVQLTLRIPESSSDLTDLIKKQFDNSRFSYSEILAITITLFLSMLPLHYDRPDRQLAFIATAIRLYKELKK